MSRAHSFALTSLLALAACADAATAPPPAPDTPAPAEAADDPSGITRTDLRALGFTESPVDVNNAGVVVGGCRDRASGEESGAYETSTLNPRLVGGQRALRWSRAEGVRDLGTLGGDAGCAAAVNEAGQVVGYSRTAAGETHAFAWTAAGGMRDLGTLPGGTESRALDVNASGVVVGWSAVGGHPRAVQWAPDGTIQPLDVSPLAGASRATGINDSGWIAGFLTPLPREVRSFAADQYQFLSTPSGGGRLFFDDPGGGGPDIATAINNRGVVVGGDDPTGSGNFKPTVRNYLTGDAPLPFNCATGSVYTYVNAAGVTTQNCPGFTTARALVNVPGEAVGRRLPTPGEPNGPAGAVRSAFAFAVNDAGQVVGELDGRRGVATLWSVPGLPGASAEPAPAPTPAIAQLRADPATGPYRVSAKACGGRFTVCLRFTVAEGVGPYRVTINWRHNMATGPGTGIVSYTIPAAGVSLLAPHDYTGTSEFLGGQVAVSVEVTDSRGARSQQVILLQLAP